MKTMTSFTAAETLTPRLLLCQPCQQNSTTEKRYYSKFMSDHFICCIDIGEFPYELNRA